MARVFLRPEQYEYWITRVCSANVVFDSRMKRWPEKLYWDELNAKNRINVWDGRVNFDSNSANSPQLMYPIL